MNTPGGIPERNSWRTSLLKLPLKSSKGTPKEVPKVNSRMNPMGLLIGISRKFPPETFARVVSGYSVRSFFRGFRLKFLQRIYFSVDSSRSSICWMEVSAGNLRNHPWVFFQDSLLGTKEVIPMVNSWKLFKKSWRHFHWNLQEELLEVSPEAIPGGILIHKFRGGGIATGYFWRNPHRIFEKKSL